jgi:hypothetical protein
MKHFPYLPYLLISGATLYAGNDAASLAMAIESRETAAKLIGQCRLSDAETVLRQGTQALEAAPGSDDLAGAAKGTIKIDLEQQLREVANQRVAIQLGQAQALQLLKTGQVESAREIWEGYRGPVCDASLGGEISRRSARAEALVKRADLEGDPRTRLKLYQEAMKWNSESADLAAKRKAAELQVKQLPCGACKTARRIVKHTLIWGGLGAATYYTYNELDRRGVIGRRQ